MATDGAEPCIDELEVFTAGAESRNVALASAGAQVKVSDVFANGMNAKHQRAHLNDGRYGNSFSWIAKDRGTGWAQIELAKAERINRMVWSRDRGQEKQSMKIVCRRVTASKFRSMASDGARSPHRSIGSGRNTASASRDSDLEPGAGEAGGGGATPGGAAARNSRSKSRALPPSRWPTSASSSSRARPIGCTGAIRCKRKRRSPRVESSSFRRPSHAGGRCAGAAAPAGAGGLDGKPAESAHGARLGESHLGTTTSAPALVETPSDFGLNGARPRIPNCSTGWHRSLWRVAGGSRNCSG